MDTQNRGRYDPVKLQRQRLIRQNLDRDALAAIKQHFLRSIDHYRSEYDLIVFDTNPNATFLTRCALEAADRVIAPMHADIYSLRGVRLLDRTRLALIAD
jgi:cellulose biosynthesis protein BcsQ